ncbi:MAG: sugar phosphate nucleotidyltransferase, partial [Candidatus Aenigmatarchaeota archaeon]
FIREFERSQVAASLLLTEVDNPEQYGLALIDEQKKVITKLLEKPKNPPTNLSIVGIYGLDPVIFEAIDNIKPSWRNELEITDALQWLIDTGRTVQYGRVEGWWKDTGRAEDILDANRLVLDGLKPEKKGKVEDSNIKGRVQIGKGTMVKGNSVIKGPAILGESCTVSNAYIGPYSSIGKGCTISDTEVENSIIMDGTRIEGAGRIVDSLIGKDVLIKKKEGLPKGKRFVIGDGSQVMI